MDLRKLARLLALLHRNGVEQFANGELTVHLRATGAATVKSPQRAVDEALRMTPDGGKEKLDPRVEAALGLHRQLFGDEESS
jgi:hypothetical protein